MLATALLPVRDIFKVSRRPTVLVNVIFMNSPAGMQCGSFSTFPLPSPQKAKMTRRRKPAAPAAGSAAAPLTPDAPSAPTLASQLGGMALGGDIQPQPTSPAESAAAASSGATGGLSTGSEPSSAVPSSKAASLSAGGSSVSPVDSTPEPSPAEERACACCTIIIAGKVFRCSRCLLVYYCGKDCQASSIACLRRLSCSDMGGPSEISFLPPSPPLSFSGRALARRAQGRVRQAPGGRGRGSAAASASPASHGCRPSSLG